MMMKTAFLPIVAVISIMGTTNAFVPQHLKESIESILAKASSLQSSRAEPVPDNLASRRAVNYKKWGVDNSGNDDEYWANDKIHTLGNTGLGGGLHAALAPISTKLIDKIAYEGVDIRKRVAEELSAKYRKEKAKVLDLCCGIGCSSRSLVNAFPDGEIVGVDTSSEMLAMAKFISAHVAHLRPAYEFMKLKMNQGFTSVINQGNQIQQEAKHFCQIQFHKGNAEQTPFKDASFDVVTIMYAFHEAPKQGRQRILEEVKRVLAPGGVLAVVDISSDYTPSKSMLAGEPYVIEYQKNIHSQLARQKGFSRAEYKTLVPGHVGMWILKRSVI